MPESRNCKLSVFLLTQVLDRLHHPVLLLDSEGAIAYLNQAMLNYVEKVTSTGWERDKVIGMDLVKVHPPDVRGRMKDRVAAVLSGQRLPPRFNTVGETMFMTYDTALSNENGDVVGLLMEKIPVNIVSDRVPSGGGTKAGGEGKPPRG